MSRIGLKPILVPTGVEINIDKKHIIVKGPKGSLEIDMMKSVSAKVEDNQIIVSRDSDKNKAEHGLTRALIANMVTGVTEGFEKKLEIKGVGYRAAKQGDKLVLTLGYSHPVEVFDTEDIKIELLDQTNIVVKGMDKQKVGQMAANIREKRPPEPYKGKGIKYVDEHIRRKEGKAGGKG